VRLSKALRKRRVGVARLAIVKGFVTLDEATALRGFISAEGVNHLVLKHRNRGGVARLLKRSLPDQLNDRGTGPRRASRRPMMHS
jgi:hypothetical protein